MEESVRFVGKERTLFKNGNINFYETKLYYTDSTIFNIFTYQFLEGNAANALNKPNSIVISKSLAQKYFGKNTAAVGKTLQTANRDLYKVTAVIEDVPKNSHILFDLLISASTLPKDFQNNWGGFNNFTYVLLKPAATAAVLEKKLLPMYEKYMAPIFAQFNIKIKYGFTDYDSNYTNVNPCALDYSFENTLSGTDLKTTLEHLPLFWKNRISEIIKNPEIDITKINQCTVKNQKNINNPYRLLNKKLNLKTITYALRTLKSLFKKIQPIP